MEKKSVRQILAENLATLMELTPNLDTQDKVSKASGVSQTSVGQILNPENDWAKSPKLTQAEKIAAAFKIEAWVLLSPECVSTYKIMI